MARLTAINLALLVVFADLFSELVQADEKPRSERQKIGALIKHVRSLTDAVFIRNDKEYDAKTAAKPRGTKVIWPDKLLPATCHTSLPVHGGALMAR